MPALSKRLQRLEAKYREDDGPARSPMSFITRQAFAHLSYEELKALESAYKAEQEGRTLTGQEGAAVEVFENATAKELESAGITVAQFNRFCSSAGYRSNRDECETEVRS